MTKTATLVKKLSGTWAGEARLYQLSEPLETYEFVIVSATVVIYCGPETYIFGADPDGNIADWGELCGSFQGGLDHERALRNAGYEVA